MRTLSSNRFETSIPGRPQPGPEGRWASRWWRSPGWHYRDPLDPIGPASVFPGQSNAMGQGCKTGPCGWGHVNELERFRIVVGKNSNVCGKPLPCPTSVLFEIQLNERDWLVENEAPGTGFATRRQQAPVSPLMFPARFQRGRPIVTQELRWSIVQFCETPRLHH